VGAFVGPGTPPPTVGLPGKTTSARRPPSAALGPPGKVGPASPVELGGRSRAVLTNDGAVAEAAGHVA